MPTLSGGSAAPAPDQAGSVSLLDDELMSLGEEAAAKALFYVPGEPEQLALLGAEEVNRERPRGSPHLE